MSKWDKGVILRVSWRIGKAQLMRGEGGASAKLGRSSVHTASVYSKRIGFPSVQPITTHFENHS